MTLTFLGKKLTSICAAPLSERAVSFSSSPYPKSMSKSVKVVRWWCEWQMVERLVRSLVYLPGGGFDDDYGYEKRGWRFIKERFYYKTLVYFIMFEKKVDNLWSKSLKKPKEVVAERWQISWSFLLIAPLMGIGASLYCSADLFVNVHFPGILFQDKSSYVKLVYTWPFSVYFIGLRRNFSSLLFWANWCTLLDAYKRHHIPSANFTKFLKKK